MAYVKLDTGILDSTLWCNRDERDLFLTALLMALPHEITEPTPALDVRTMEPLGWDIPAGWYGLVGAAGIGIVRRSGLDGESGLDALARLGQPDPESRTADFEGRRVVRVSGGFVVLNFMKYRDRDGTAAERQRRYRERNKVRVIEPDGSITVTSPRNGHAVTTANITEAVSSKQEAVSSKQKKQKTTTAAEPEVVPVDEPESWDDVLAALIDAGSPHGAEAYTHYLARARTPAAVAGELRMLVGGARGVTPSWADIGNALHEMLVASAPFTSRVVLGFLRRNAQPQGDAGTTLAKVAAAVAAIPDGGVF